MLVPNLRDKTPEAPFPSELNPLTNPVLEQNLGRWAKVYFNNPPAKREQAVNNLLEEIKRESGANAPAAARPDRPYFATDPRFQRAACSACQHQNPPGHKFCSRCGQALSAARPRSTENLGAPRLTEAFPSGSDNDLEWLSDEAFSGLGDPVAPRKRGWKYLAGAALIVVAGFAYVQWVPGPLTRVAAPANARRVTAAATSFPPETSLPAESEGPARTITPESAVPESVAPESVAPASVAPASVAPKSITSESKEHEAQNRPATAEARRRTVVPPGTQQAAQKSPLLDATTSHQTVADLESSAPDLRLAQRYLGGTMGVRDPSEAAKLLWKAVSKQNTAAAVLLSNLYLRGDGVPRSCDQARLLLVAAAKRGSPLAAQQLRNLESQGCR
jgi:hypothetical protein